MGEKARGHQELLLPFDKKCAKEINQGNFHFSKFIIPPCPLQ
jgi:hypothetical protein